MAKPGSQISFSLPLKTLVFVSLEIAFCFAQAPEHFSKGGEFVFGNFVEKKSNFALVGNDSLIANLTVDSEVKCQEICTTHPQCLSVNHAEVGSEGKVQCETWRYGRTDYQDHLVSKTGSTHLRLKTVCTNNPCFNEFDCIPVLGNPNKDHFCVCRHSESTNIQYCEADDVKCNALGIESSKILNSQITSSGALGAFPSFHARLNFGGSWIPSPIANSWLMIDLLKSTTILAVATQGRHDKPELFRTYEVHHRPDDAASFTPYQEDGGAKSFIGNSNSVDIVKHMLKMPFVAKAVRFVPKTWSSGNPGWRVELYGC